MSRRRSVLIALGPMIAVVAIGCGSSGGGSTGTTNPKGVSAELRENCLQSREGIGGIPPGLKDSCNEAGVTATSPSPGSPEAQQALRAIESSAKHIEKQESGRPVFEKQARTAAMLDLTKGHRAEAESKLKEGCAKANSSELSAAWSELQKLATPGSGVTSEAVLTKDLEKICPL